MDIIRLLIITLKQYSQCCMQMCPEEDYSTVVELMIIDVKIWVGQKITN